MIMDTYDITSKADGTNFQSAPHGRLINYCPLVSVVTSHKHIQLGSSTAVLQVYSQAVNNSMINSNYIVCP